MTNIQFKGLSFEKKTPIILNQFLSGVSFEKKTPTLANQKLTQISFEKKPSLKKPQIIRRR